MMYVQKILIPMVFCTLIASPYSGHSQSPQKEEWKKTVTAPNGEVILNMSGEWDVVSEGYGEFSIRPTLTDILTITQKGTTFTAVKQIGSRWVPKGAKTIKGELDKNGFKEVLFYIHARDFSKFDWEPCRWKITDGGDRVILDCGDRVKATLTRK